MRRMVLAVLIGLALSESAYADTIHWNESVNGDLLRFRCIHKVCNDAPMFTFDLGQNIVLGSTRFAGPNLFNSDFDHFTFQIPRHTVVDRITYSVTSLELFDAPTYYELGWALKQLPRVSTVAGSGNVLVGATTRDVFLEGSTLASNFWYVITTDTFAVSGLPGSQPGFSTGYTWTVQVSQAPSVPEPTLLSLVGTAGGAWVLRRRRRR